jgi:hypothetical protein
VTVQTFAAYGKKQLALRYASRVYGITLRDGGTVEIAGSTDRSGDTGQGKFHLYTSIESIPVQENHRESCTNYFTNSP